MQKYIRLGAQAAKADAWYELTTLVENVLSDNVDRNRYNLINDKLKKLDEALTILEQPTYK